jgi:hypothetical protein
MVAEGRKGPFVGFDQKALADGGYGLKPGQVARPLRHSQTPHPGTHRAGTDQHRFSAAGHYVVKLPGKLVDASLMELAVVARQDLRADFDDERAGKGGNFLSQYVGHDSSEG